MSSEEVIYCICRSSDVSRFMIGCDHCEEWYHGDCINVTAQESKYIKKFFCKECRKKNPKLEVVFKSKYTEKQKELNQTTKKERREDHSEKEKKSKEKKKNWDKERERERSKERHKHKEKKNKKDRDERKDEKKHKHKSKHEDKDRDERKEKEEKKEKKSKPVISDSDDDADKGNDKNKEKEKEKLEEAEKEKARRKEKELQKERQKLREEKRKEKEEEEAERKRKEAKEREKKEKSQSTESKAKHEPEKTKSAPSKERSSSEDDWKPAAVQPPPSLKRKPLKEQGSNKRKRAWRPDYGSSEDEEVHDLAPRQCYGMDCINCARVGSKYCSDQCGLTVASLRIYQTLPERIREWNMTSCKAESKNGKELESIRQEILVAKQRLEELDRDAEKLETTITKGKSMTLIEHNAEDSSDEDEEVRGSGGAINCISCGKDIPARIAIRHMESCFNKIESQTSFGSMYKTKIEGYQMFCDFFNPQTGTYCKRLRVICPEHTKDLKMSDSEVCGYPLTKHVFQSSGEYCRLSRKACNEHYCWEKLKRAELDMDRVRQWLKLDELLEKERQEKEAMSRRAGVLNLLLHSTFNHEMAKILQKKNSRTNLPQAKPQKHQTMDSSKVESVLKKLNISLDLWKVKVRAGQILLKDILTNLYPAEKEREPLPADDSLQQACEGLTDVLRELQEVVNDVEVARSRLAALSNLVGEGECIEMNNNTVNVRELRDWVINLHLEFKAQVLQAKPWGLNSLVDMFWGFISFMTLFFKTLVDPSLNKKGDGYATDYRSTGGRGGPPGGGPRRRFGGFHGGQGGASAPPMAGGGGG